MKDNAMTAKKLLRRRSAIREFLQNLPLQPYCKDLPAESAGWISRPRPRIAAHQPAQTHS
jgi:hypothetical protein